MVTSGQTPRIPTRSHLVPGDFGDRQLNESGEAVAPAPPGATSPPAAIARIETDRFCGGCGYNLFSQAVFRDPATQLLLCRCPECGAFHAVGDATTIGQAWLRRLGSLALFIWMAVVLAVVVGLVLGQAGLMVGTLEELTTYTRIPTAAAGQISGAMPATMPGLTAQPVPGGPIITISGGNVSVAPAVGMTLQRVARPAWRDWEDVLLLVLVHGGELLLGFALAAWLAIVLHHWRRWGNLLVVVILIGGAGLAVWSLWSFEAPELSQWATPYLVILTSAALVGGLGGVYLGRPAARLAVRLLLPPRARQPLAFLWVADGKAVPQCRTGEQGASE